MIHQMRTLPACALLLLGSFALAQQPQPQPAPGAEASDPAKIRFWEASIGENGHYMVALDRISSISRHQYLTDTGIIVDEVTVDAVGQSLVRFYYMAPATDAAQGSAAGQVAGDVVDRARDMTERAAELAGTDAHKMAFKTYPQTTHAKEIEFVISDKDQLTALYDSVKKAWTRGRGEKFTAE